MLCQSSQRFLDPHCRQLMLYSNQAPTESKMGLVELDTYLRQVMKQICPFYSEDTEIFSAANIVVFKTRKLSFNTKHIQDCCVFIVPFTEPETSLDRSTCVEAGFACSTAYAAAGYLEQCTFYYILIFIQQHFLEYIAETAYGTSKITLSDEGHTASHHLYQLIKMFIQESSNPQSGCELVLHSLSTQLVVQLLRETIRSSSPLYNEGAVESSSKNIQTAIDFLRNHYRGQFTLDQIARCANYSPYHFIRVFKAETGKTPFEYLLDIKIDKAKELLQKKNMTITEACFLSGFNNLSHFTAVFKKKVGTTPSAYKNRCLSSR